MYELIEELNGIALWKYDGRFSVTGIDRRAGQVTSVMPRDMPSGGGAWFARITDGGIAYVAGLYSRGYARRKFAEFAGARGCAKCNRLVDEMDITTDGLCPQCCD